MTTDALPDTLTINGVVYRREGTASEPAAPRKRFVPPTVDEVADYCRQHGKAVDAERFVAYYTSNGWRVGRNPMKSWHAAIATWAKGQSAAPVCPHPEGSARAWDWWALHAPITEPQ